MNTQPVIINLSLQPHEITAQLSLPEDLPCFVGHYPGFPVLPGVVQLHWVMQLAMAHLPYEMTPASDFRVKYRRVITPGRPLTLSVRHDAVRCRLDFSYRVGELIASEGRVAPAVP